MKENQKKLPIIFIHGMWKGSWIFGDWLDFVLTADGRDTYVPSLRGYNSKHDDNNIVTGIVSIYDYVNDIKNFVKQKGINHYDIVGYSAGGLIGQVLASRDERVRSVTYVASLPPKGIKVRGAGVS